MRRLILLLVAAALLAVSCAQPQAAWTSSEPLGAVADLGLRPKTDGFNFVNFTRGPNGLTLSEGDVRSLLGDSACAPGDTSQECDLDSRAAEFQNDNRRLATGGVCEGLSILGLMFYTGELDPRDFGADSPYELQLPENPELERQILVWNASQLTEETTGALQRGAPTEILDTLTRAWASGEENYTLGLYNRVDGKLENGHATIPYKIEQMGDGQVRLYIYNSNLPGEEEYIEIDANTDSWSYDGQYTTYDGSAELELAPLSARIPPPLIAKPLSDFRGQAGPVAHCFAG